MPSEISRRNRCFHTCYGINIGPRVHEMPLKDIVDIMLKIHAGAYSFEAANPSHEHEWRVWESVKLPEGKVLIPGVISHTTNLGNTRASGRASGKVRQDSRARGHRR